VCYSLSFVSFFFPPLSVYIMITLICARLVAKGTDVSSFRRKQSGNGSNILTVRRAIRCMHILCTNPLIVRVTLQSVRNYTDVSVAGGRETIVSLLTDGLVGSTVQ
jgi:hypothetical protein